MDYYVGEIRLFAGTYAPVGWNLCDGSTLSISTYQTLYALIGTTYGGDGVTNFKVPDLRGRVPIGQGTGNNLTTRVLGQAGGTEAVTLTSANLPSHTHSLMAINVAATASTPSGALLAAPTGRVFYATNPTPPAPANPTVQLDPRVVNTALGQPGGSTLSHNNLMGSLGLNFIIAVNGTFPSQN